MNRRSTGVRAVATAAQPLAPELAKLELLPVVNTQGYILPEVPEGTQVGAAACGSSWDCLPHCRPQQARRVPSQCRTACPVNHNQATVFAIYDADKALQYIGFSKDLRNSLRTLLARHGARAWRAGSERAGG